MELQISKFGTWNSYCCWLGICKNVQVCLVLYKVMAKGWQYFVSITSFLLNEFWSVCKSPSFSCYKFTSNIAKKKNIFIFVIGQKTTTEFHTSNSWSRRSLGEKHNFLIFWDLTFKAILITRLHKSSSTQSEVWNDFSTRKVWYMIEKQWRLENLVHWFLKCTLMLSFKRTSIVSAHITVTNLSVAFLSITEFYEFPLEKLLSLLLCKIFRICLLFYCAYNKFGIIFWCFWYCKCSIA